MHLPTDIFLDTPVSKIKHIINSKSTIGLKFGDSVYSQTQTEKIVRTTNPEFVFIQRKYINL